jgi:phospholipid/cholesterol/gamma-HCH transport system substrate-binding protein
MSKTFRLGLFIVATLAVLCIGVFIIGSRQLLFKPTYGVRAEFQNVAGLADGADVRVGGIHKGTVRHIDLPNRPDGKVSVSMDLESATRGIIKKDSTAAIKSEGLLGDKYVEISFGSAEAERLKDGDTIPSEAPLEVSQLMKKTDQILDSAKEAVDEIGGTATNMKSISGKIDEGKGTMGALINDKTIYKQVNAGATAFQEDMEALKHNFLLRGFFKKRGYEDSQDLTKNLISRLPAAPPVQTFIVDPQKVFDKPDTAKIKNDKALNEAGSFLQSNKYGLAVIVASTSLKGDTEKNRVLTEARAMVVRDYLAKNFQLDDSRVKTMGVGESSKGNTLEVLVYPASSGVPPVARKNP